MDEAEVLIQENGFLPLKPLKKDVPPKATERGLDLTTGEQDEEKLVLFSNPSVSVEQYQKALLEQQQKFVVTNRGKLSQGAVGMNLGPRNEHSASLRNLLFSDDIIMTSNKSIPGLSSQPSARDLAVQPSPQGKRQSSKVSRDIPNLETKKVAYETNLSQQQEKMIFVNYSHKNLSERKQLIMNQYLKYQ